MTSIKPLLQVRDLSAGYAGSRVLFDVSMNISQGEVVALLGRNGMGKSTFIRSLFGLTTYMGGTIHFRDQPIEQLASFKVARAGLGWVPEGRQIFATLTVQENLMASFKKTSQISRVWRLEDVYELFPRLAERKTHYGNQLSGGEQQMLAVGRILRTGAKCLLLDEISEGLAPVIVQALAKMITALKAKGFTIIMVEQNFRFAAPLADRFYVMEHGQIVEGFSSQELSSKMSMLHEYLGV